MTDTTKEARVGAALSRPHLICQLGQGFADRLRHDGLDVSVHPKGTPVWEPAAGAELLFTHPRPWAGAPAEKPASWPGSIRFVQLASAGIDGYPAWLFDGPVVCSSRGIAAAPIAEYVMAAILTVAKEFDRLAVDDPAQWRQRMLGGLSGSTLALIGYGAIGQAVARRALAFDMKVKALRRSGSIEDEGVETASDINDLIVDADHLVLALPMTEATHHMINAASLAHAKPGLHIVNISRGGLIDQDALLAALDEGRIGHATLDVTDPEPLPQGHPIYSHPKIHLTPHISYADIGTEQRLADKALHNSALFLAGETPLDVVDPSRGY